jgi:hypothetical protein
MKGRGERGGDRRQSQGERRQRRRGEDEERREWPSRGTTQTNSAPLHASPDCTPTSLQLGSLYPTWRPPMFHSPKLSLGSSVLHPAPPLHFTQSHPLTTSILVYPTLTRIPLLEVALPPPHFVRKKTSPGGSVLVFDCTRPLSCA